MITDKKEGARQRPHLGTLSKAALEGVNHLLGQLEARSLEGDFSCALPINEDMKCEVVEKERNNGQRRVGITFSRPGQEIAPVIYVEPFYKSVQQGEPLEDVMREIARTVELEMKNRPPITASQISEYDRIKEYLGVKLVNTKANRRNLKDITHIEMEDMSLIPVIRFPMPEQEMYGNMKITEELRRAWGVSVHDIFEQAWKNEEPPVLQELGDAVSYGEDIHDLFAVERLTNDTMYVLTNQRAIDGAIQIALPGVMKKLSEYLFELEFDYKINDNNTLSLIDLTGANLANIEQEEFEINEVLGGCGWMRRGRDNYIVIF